MSVCRETDHLDDSKKRPVPVSSTSSLDSCNMLSQLQESHQPVDIQGDQGEASHPTEQASQRNKPLQTTLSTFLPATIVPSPLTTFSKPQREDKPLSNQLLPPSTLSGNLLIPSAAHSTGNSVPEFLYQLTKMLTDDNRDIIEWSDGLIKVHSPIKLESQVLHKYFRHSKFSSFQRQLNYFGFRKLAGKGKMAPCSYSNESAGQEISSLLYIKRKNSTVMTNVKEKSKKRGMDKGMGIPKTEPSSIPSVNPVLAGILHRSTQPVDSQQAIARSAVGRGIRHNYTAPLATPSNPVPTDHVGHALPAPNSNPGQSIQHDDLSQLETNFHNSLNDLQSTNHVSRSHSLPRFGGFLSPNSSLIDLAMIPLVGDSEGNTATPAQPQNGSNDDDPNIGWNFDDFPYPEIHPDFTSATQDESMFDGNFS